MNDLPKLIISQIKVNSQRSTAKGQKSIVNGQQSIVNSQQSTVNYMNILIIEDENAAARRLEKLVVEIAPEAKVLDRLDSVEAAVLWLKNNPQPDLILLDITWLTVQVLKFFSMWK